MVDPRLARDEHAFFDGVDVEGVDAVALDARTFVEEMYFRDLAWVYEPITGKNAIGASQGVIDYHRYPAPVGIHIRRITARYAGGVSLDTFAGARDGEFVSERESEITFPLGTVIEINDKVLVLAKGPKPQQWFTITSVDDTSSDALMVVTRGQSTGVPDGIDNV